MNAHNRTYGYAASVGAEGVTVMGPVDTPWLTVSQAAARAKVGERLIYNACRDKKLRHVRLGGRRDIRLRAEWIDEWLSAQVIESEPVTSGQVVPLEHLRRRA
jgi:excisionase family DNA binding protein